MVRAYEAEGWVFLVVPWLPRIPQAQAIRTKSKACYLFNCAGFIGQPPGHP